VRALFFTDTPIRLAGAQKSLLTAVTRARDLGLVEPIMVMPSGGLFRDACEAARLEHRVLEGSRAYNTYGRGLLRMGPLAKLGVLTREILPYASAFARLVDRERVEVVHFNTARGTIMAGAGAFLARRPSVLHVRGTPRFDRKLWLASQALSHRIVLVARALMEDLAPSVRPRGRVVYNGVSFRPPIDRATARALLEQRGVAVPQGATVFASLSSLVPFKGLHHLARAARLLEDRGVRAVYLICGTGNGTPYEAWLRALVDRLGLAERFLFLGFVEDVHAVLSASDALVLPSVEREELDMDGARLTVDGNEGLPRSVLEAMGAGIGAIASEVAGVREQIEDGASGLVVPPGDVPALADALDRCARSPVLRATIGARAAEIGRSRFDLDAAARGLVRVLGEAADERVFLSTATAAIELATDVVRRAA
jgi:glycosyltransferase involved in cell wall biosynthesis